MHKSDFMWDPWWLSEPLDHFPALFKRRELLGRCFGWAQDWFSYQPNLGYVYDFVEANRPDLLAQIDTLHLHTEREQWLDNVILAKGLPHEIKRNPDTDAWEPLTTIDEILVAMDSKEPPAAQPAALMVESPALPSDSESSSKPSPFGEKKKGIGVLQRYCRGERPPWGCPVAGGPVRGGQLE